jgi:acetyl-CoA C-acetyltransferase
MKSVYICDGIRTPMGSYGGALSSIRPDDLLALTLHTLLTRNPDLDPKAVEEVYAGGANQSGEDNRNVARMAALLARLPETVAGVTVNRLCASGLQAVVEAYRGISLGEGRVMLAGGVESMSRAPWVMAKPTEGFSRSPKVYDTTLGWRFVNPKLTALHHPYSMGETAENVAEKYHISREAQDAFAFGSQQKYAAAHATGRFAREIVPVSIPQRKGEPKLVQHDEPPRPDTTLEKLAALKPVFRTGGTVTAGNSSPINDGAAALLLADESAIQEFKLTPRARVVQAAAAGVDPAIMGIGPVPAIQKLVARSGISLSDVGLIELNEAFAAQSLACIQLLGLNPDNVNVNGGAIAIGHPLGCSGARLALTLTHELQERNIRYGIASLCIGVGQGLAVLLEKV